MSDEEDWGYDQNDIDAGNQNQENSIDVLFFITREEAQEEEEMEVTLERGFTCEKLYQVARQISGQNTLKSGIDIRITHQGEQLPDDGNVTIEQFNIQDGSYIYLQIETAGGY